MNKTLITTTLFCLMGVEIIAQNAIPKKQLKLDPILLQKDVQFNVVGQTEETSSRVEKVNSFQLKPNEKNAVAITGKQMTALDRTELRNIGDFKPETKIYTLPELYYGREAITNEQITYKILFIDSAPLRFDLSKNAFEGSVSFLPVETSGSGNPLQKKLASPNDIIVSYGVEKIPLKITDVNWPPMDVNVNDSNPRDSVGVKVLTISNPLGYEKFLDVEPTIMLSSTRNTIQGFGIQTLPVNVSLKGVSSYKPISVTIESSLGTVDKSSITLADDQSQQIVFRSEGLGDINLKAYNSNYGSSSISIKAIFPWLFLILSLLGGLIGSLGKGLLGKEKISSRHLAYGSIAGLMAAVAFWGLGIMLIGFQTEMRGINEAMVFGFGLLAGYFGLKIPGLVGKSST